MFRILKSLLPAFAAIASMCSGFAGDSPALDEKWIQSAIAPAAESFEIRGTGGRNNPIRRALTGPFNGEEFFIRFNLRYEAASIDLPGKEKNGGEFFILWLDENEGDDTASHNGGVPNLGVHVSEGRNTFMVRYASQAEKHTNIPLEGDRERTLVARLWKTKPGAEEPFDNLDLWIDPLPGSEFKPHASASNRKSIRSVNWLGFATGGKTESTDRIHVSDIRIADNWRAILGLPPSTTAPVLEPEPDPVPVIEKTVAFAKDVYPILKERCFECHSGDKPKAGFHLDILDQALNRTRPYDAEASRLIQLVTEGDPEKRMPPPKAGPALNEAQIAVLKAWINEGVDWDENFLPTPAPRTDHWSFQPIRRPQIPKVKNQAWVRTPIDAFIARGHEEAGLTPAPVADDATLRRRIALDLTGLPPSASSNAAADDAYIDELLYSKQHGERWARHWLDLARWAESNGHQHNRDRPHAWRYRDYVIRSFAEDKPFDQFIREQLAGDELPYADEHFEALGYLAAARYSGNDLDKEIQRNDILVDIVNTTGKTFLGLTVECAQCHEHKFDPLSLRDYYRLQAFFTTGQPGNVILGHETDRAAELVAERWNIFDAAHARMVAARRKKGYPEPILVSPESVIKGLTAEEKKFFNTLEKEIAQLPQAWSFYSETNAAEKRVVAPHEMRWPLSRHLDRLAKRRTYIRIRGDVGSPGPEVTPGWPAVFGNSKPLDPEHPRTQLADWLASKDNPLTARVWANRIWQWHFGRGLVETSGDFGRQGAKPSHPELLDWLASELMDNGWSARHLHRLIVGSSAYRQSSAFNQANADKDPENRLLWRREPRRLEAEAIRDSVLAVAGTLDLKAGGPSVPIDKAATSTRRSVYLKQKRDKLPHQQMLFDGANALTACSHRRVSTVALQPLYLLNNEFMQGAAAAFAKRVGESAKRPEDQAHAAIELALSRPARAEEIAKAAPLIESQGLEAFCLALFNLNEFVYAP